MADVRPFRGIRYNQEAIGDLSLVVSPPYDIISDKDRDIYYNKHPYNVIRLILNRPKKSDGSENERHQRAAQFLERWSKQRILIHDNKPSLYLYRQRYLIGGDYRECTGIVARVRLEDFNEGGIRPHEEIMPKTFSDRMELLKLVKTNMSMVQGLYSDPSEKLRESIMAETERFPLAQFQTFDGMAHDLWAIPDIRFIEKVSSFLRERPLYIADGHHRYQTALEYSRIARDSDDYAGGDDPRNFIMMQIVEMENPGLSLLPVHRVVTGDMDIELERLEEDLGRYFAVKEVEVPKGARSGQVLHLLNQMEIVGKSERVFGAYLGKPQVFLLMSWKGEEDVKNLIDGDRSDSYKDLDVTVLHSIILGRLLGMPQDRASVEESMVFTRDPIEAVKLVDEGAARIVFFQNPIKPHQVRNIADDGDKMPQKSTYFYPKPYSGVVMNRITDW
ncbi:MAG: DUF1015 domain-containing protein [Actinobacteria bacterium]|nr:DUF1015 domain-containing protein [Actinomycetota bacterium]